MSNWITIKEAKEIYSISDATLRRLSKRLKDENSRHIKYETLKTGHKKVLFSEAFLNKEFRYNSNTQSNYSKNTQSNSSDILQVLRDQLKEKDEQIRLLLQNHDEQIRLLLQNQHEQNVIIQTLQSKTLLLEDKPKKRWWQRG